MTKTTELLQTLSTYAPPSVARQAFRNPHRQPGGTWRRFHAATAFADISGFTPLAEDLATGGVRGAEELTSVLNRVFEALITAVESHGGRVVKFGGDALSLTWPCEPENMAEAVWRAIEAAFDMQAAMARFTTVSTSQGEFELRMKIGIGAGELLEVHAGGVFGRWEYVLADAPMANMSSAENHARAGEIVIDETGNYVASLSAQGEAFLTNTEPAKADECLQEAIQHLQEGSGSGEYPAQSIWWIYAQTCRNLNKTDEAAQALQWAYDLVKAKADQICEPQL